MTKQEDYTFEKMEILQGKTPGTVWVAIHSKEGPIRAFEATSDQLMTMGQMMIAIAARLPSVSEQN